MKIDYYKLRQARRKAGLRLSDVAEQIGVNKATYWRWENNATHMPAEALFLILALYGVTIDDITNGGEPDVR
jgi:transcriptional regulator with XRE-family HTH domain